MKTKLKSIITLLVVFMVQITFAQERNISGVVSDDMGPVADISVKVKGTDRGTVTDFDGNYAIKAKTGDTIVFTHVAYGTVEKIVGTSSKIDVTMNSAGTELDEVVITAGVAGATSKKKMSVSVASVKAEDINIVPTTSAASALQGKVAGVSVTNLGRPGSGASIILRGAANLYGSQEPLIVMDGVIVEGGLSSVNVDDIESMEIVKGASASSYYGSRAGNGVIVIKTKRGKLGKTNVTFRNEIGMSKITNFIKTNQSHHYKLSSDWEDYKGQYTKYDGVTYPSTYQGVYSASGYVDAVVGSPTASDDHYSDNPYGVYNNHQKEFFKTGLDQTLYASVSSGFDKARIFVSAEKTNMKGVLKEAEGYDRTSIRANADIFVNDWFTIKSSNNFIKTNDHSPVGDSDFYRTLTRLAPDAKPTLSNPDGQPYYFHPDPLDSEITNPLYDLYARDAATKKQRFLGGYSLNFKLAKWLNADVEYSFENTDSKYLRNNKYETFENGTGGIGFQYSKGGLYSWNYNELSQKIQTNLNFKKSFGDLDFNGKLSYLIENRRFDDVETQGSQYKYPNLVSFDNFDQTNITAHSDTNDERAKNYFAIAGFVYKDRYILDALYRKDGSSLFGANQRWNDYYRLSGAYRISKDIEIPGIQELKVSAAIGTSGQRPSFDWQYNRFPIYGGATSTNVYVANPDLKPSLTTEKEISLTSSFLNRFDLEVTYSNQIVSDQFMSADVFPPANPGNKKWVNVGDLTSDVFEASLNSKIIKKDNVKWNLGINFTTANTTITKLNYAEQFVGPRGNEIFLIREGEEFGNMFGRKFVTDLETMANQLPTGTSIDDYAVNSDGVVVERSKIGTVDEKPFIKVDEDGIAVSEVIGNQNADFKVGLVSNFLYKNIGFYMLWDWKQGGDIYNRNNQWNTIKNRSAMVDQAGKDDRDKKTVDYYAQLYDVNQNNAFWVEDGSYVKLRELSLSYTFTGKLLSNVAKGFFNEVKVSAIGKNLLTFSKYSGWDPEVSKYDANTMQYFSVDYGVYPNQATYAFSFQFKF